MQLRNGTDCQIGCASTKTNSKKYRTRTNPIKSANSSQPNILAPVRPPQSLDCGDVTRLNQRGTRPLVARGWLGGKPSAGDARLRESCHSLDSESRATFANVVTFLGSIKEVQDLWLRAGGSVESRARGTHDSESRATLSTRRGERLSPMW